MLGCARDPETSMRHFPLMTFTFLGLALSLSVAACQDDTGMDTMATSAETTNGDGDGDSGDGDGDSGDGDGDADTNDTGECVTEQPPICEQFVRCIGALVPDQLPTVEEQYGVDGSCWCGTVDEANECFATCTEQVDNAIMSNPTEQQCHESVCGIEELDPNEPYGPIVNGACAPYMGEGGDMLPQDPIMSPFGVPGGFCAPPCSGLANYCPESAQTSAQGTCYLQLGMTLYCISRCYVDPTVVGGTQCQCGATCQPQGGADGEGNLRGICTFE
jgi:hypothetical protein